MFGMMKKIFPAVLMVLMTAPGMLQAAPAWDTNPKKVRIPDVPVQGRVHGLSFTHEYARIENGILTLSQGEASSPTREIIIFLFLDDGAIPADRVFTINKTSGPWSPHIHISWTEDDQGASQHEVFMQGYALRLEFGAVENGKLPGKIYLSVPDRDRSVVAGIFEADVKGFVLVGGEPDLTADSLKTLKYLAEAYLKKEYAGETVTVLNTHEPLYTHPYSSKKFQTGHVEVEYRVGSRPPIVDHIQFIKEADGWRVLRKLRSSQIREAHPYEVPSDERYTSEEFFRYTAAKRIEQDVHEHFPGKAIRGVRFEPSFDPLTGVGECKIGYTVEGEGDFFERRFLFRLQDEKWALERELKDNEKINLETGKIIQ